MGKAAFHPVKAGKRTAADTGRVKQSAQVTGTVPDQRLNRF
ncbi:hypothetical protein [Desulfobacter postgatei]|nr:hypothetical protein [Desulfobacter postgatei]MDX9962258.1 hypothetical protein [Desulfobacter postgatei]